MLAESIMIIGSKGGGKHLTGTDCDHLMDSNQHRINPVAFMKPADVHHITSYVRSTVETAMLVSVFRRDASRNGDCISPKAFNSY